MACSISVGVSCQPRVAERGHRAPPGEPRLKQNRDAIAAWVGTEVLPHEADARRRLRRARLTPDQIDDMIQEAYCRIAALDSVSHIACGRAYLFGAVRNIFLKKIRRERIVSIIAVAELDSFRVLDDEPSPERIAAGRVELRRVQCLIESLPAQCRRIFVLRRIHGVSQKEIARTLGISENTVETQCVRGLKKILRGLAKGADYDIPTENEKSDVVLSRKA